MTAAPRPWVANKPEQRLSIAVDRFLDLALLLPCYFTAIHDADGGARTDLQRIRDRSRGIKPGQLDWEVWQGPNGLARRVELKRGKNKPSDHQLTTISKLDMCGARPIVAWTLRQVYGGLAAAGFGFTANVATHLQHCEALLDGWDREAEDILSGVVVRKPRATKPRKTRVTAGALAAYRRAGVLV